MADVDPQEQVVNILTREMHSHDGLLEGEIKRVKFKPEERGLSKDFCLTNFSALKGWGCKVPQEKLLTYLQGISNDLKPNETPGMDASVVKLQHQDNMYMISTTDFFYPLVDDPYVQVRCSTVLSEFVVSVYGTIVYLDV